MTLAASHLFFILHSLSRPSQIAAERLKSCLNRLYRGGEREAQMAFTMGAKHDARHRRDLRSFQQNLGRLAAVATDARYVGKRIKRPRRRLAGQTQLI